MSERTFVHFMVITNLKEPRTFYMTKVVSFQVGTLLKAWNLKCDIIYKASSISFGFSPLSSLVFSFLPHITAASHSFLDILFFYSQVFMTLFLMFTIRFKCPSHCRLFDFTNTSVVSVLFVHLKFTSGLSSHLFIIHVPRYTKLLVSWSFIFPLPWVWTFRILFWSSPCLIFSCIYSVFVSLICNPIFDASRSCAVLFDYLPSKLLTSGLIPD